MKEGIHPSYHMVNVTCSCGAKHQIQSTYGQETLSVEVCSKCHPAYTGKKITKATTGPKQKFEAAFGSFLDTGSSE